MGGEGNSWFGSIGDPNSLPSGSHPIPGLCGCPSAHGGCQEDRQLERVVFTDH